MNATLPRRQTLTLRAGDAVEELMRARTQYARIVSAPNYDAMATWDDVGADAMALGCLMDAEPFWWELPIVGVVEAASEALKKWTARSELFPVRSGFCLFARGIPIPNYGSQGTRPLVAFAWGGGGGDFVTLACFTRDEDGFLFGAHGAFVPMGATLDPDEATPAHMTSGGWRERGRTPTWERGVRMLQIVGACLLFLEQRVAVSSIERPDRATRRRLAKADVNYPELRVIRLRTPKSSPRRDDPQSVDWQNRWMVRGHWRQQFYASDQSHRPIWVAPYIKGPEDKPLKTPERSVFAVVR